MTFAVYLATLCPAVRFWDSAELTAAAYSLGVAHSPGFPLYIIAGRFLILPGFVSPAVAVNLLSALCAAGAVSLVLCIFHVLEGRLNPGAYLAAGIMAFGGFLWAQAVRAEVYAPAILLIEVSIYFALSFRQSGRVNSLIAAVYFWGMASATHSAAAFAALPPLMFIILTEGRWRGWGWKRIFTSTAVLILAWTVYVYIPLRSHLGPALNWGGVESFGDFWLVVSGREFAFSINSGGWSEFIPRLTRHWKMLYSNFPLPLALLTLLGLWIKRKEFWLPMLFVFGSCLTLFREELPHPDHKGYLLPAVLAGSILAGAGFNWLISLLKRRPARFGRVSVGIITAALFLCLLLPLIAAQYPVNDLRDSRWAEKMGRDMLEGLTGGSIILFSDISSYFICRCLQVVEKARLDCDCLLPGLLSEGSLSRGWYRRQLLSKGNISGLADDVHGGETAVIARIIEANHTARPVFCEYGEKYRPFRHYLRPDGLLFRVVLTGDSSDCIEREYDFPLKREFSRDRGAALAFAARLYQRGLYYYDVGRFEEASEAFYQAKLLSDD